MYKVINKTHIQKMPDEITQCDDFDICSRNSDAGCYREKHPYSIRLVRKNPKLCNSCVYRKEPATILRGDNGQWKQGQVLQDDEVEFYCKHCSDLLNDKIEVFCSGTKENPCGSVAVPAKLYDEDEDDLAQAVMEYRRDHPEPKPKPIETLFKEAMEKEAEDQCFDAQEDRIFLRGAQTAFNYLLTNKMIK